MPAKWFKCPDGEIIEIEKCLENGGCRMGQRCATKPFLRLVAYDRKWEGVSPSSAGNGPRYLYLKATTDYVIDPNDRVFASFGTAVHNKLSLYKYTHNVLSEQKLSDDEMKGIADVLEEDENKEGFYILSDYKTGGSYKVAQQLGIVKREEPIIENGEPVLLKSGKNKGNVKTRSVTYIDPAEVDLMVEELQLNRYRIFFESYGFPISHMQIQAIPRDGGTYIAKNRGIEKNLYIIPIRRLDDNKVIEYYQKLSEEVDEGFKTGFVRKCNEWENWNGRRCENYCEVADACRAMDNK